VYFLAMYFVVQNVPRVFGFSVKPSSGTGMKI